MKKNKVKTGETDPSTGNRIPHAEKALRKRAEEIILGKTVQSAENFDTLTPEEIRQTLHELRVHQIELEMQNEELRKTQTELDDSRTRYFDLYDLAPVGYITVNEKGLILEANLTAVTMLGVTRSDLARQFINRFIINEFQDIYYFHRKILFNTGVPQVCELKMTHARGTSFWTRLEAALSHGGDGTALCNVIMSDISEQKRGEEALKESEDKYKKLVELSPDSIIVHSEEKIIFANHSALILLGAKSLEELTGKSVLSFVHPDYKDLAIQRIKKIYKDQEKEDLIEEKFINQNGDVIDVEVTAIPLNYAGKPSAQVIIRDITDRKKVEVELRESKQVTEDIINAIQARVFWKDRNLTYLGCNAEFARDAGFSDPKDLLGKDDYQMGWHDQAELYRSDDLQVIESGCPKLNIEEPQTTPDGNTITLLTNKTPLLDLNGKIIGVIGTYIDISRRKQAEEKNLRQLEELQRWQEVILRREDRNRQLKQEVNELLIRLGETIRYPSQINHII